MADQHVKCAPCKKEGKKCESDCDLGKFLPEDEGEDDTNYIHDVYGLENLREWVKQTREEKKAELVEALAWEAGMRVQFPVTGSYGVIQALIDEGRELKVKANQLRAEQRQLQSKLKGIGGGEIPESE